RDQALQHLRQLRRGNGECVHGRPGSLRRTERVASRGCFLQQGQHIARCVLAEHICHCDIQGGRHVYGRDVRQHRGYNGKLLPVHGDHKS
ncbi:unnamed protein product, partial [Ectocarpus sp. 12 AP-2014]